MSSETSVGGHPHTPASSTRTDTWWVEPLLYLLGLSAFLVYATWRAVFVGHWWYFGADEGFGGYISPFFSPPVFIKDPGLLGHAPLHHAWFGDWSNLPGWIAAIMPPFVVASPGFLILPFPGAFRFTCYYYRKAYYRSFVGSPPGCAVTPMATGKKLYKGETFLLLFQNLHRYALYAAIAFIFFLAYDAVQGFFRGGKFGVGVGSIVLLVNVTLLASYTFGCHSFRHLVGGRKDCMTCDGKAGARFALWKKVTFLNERHMRFAWLSLFWVGFSDFYVWMVSSGRLHDFSTWGN
jgi:hypothetical protein